MFELFAKLDHVVIVIIAGCFTWFVTVLGAGCIFFFKNVDKKILNSMMGLAAGVMIAASFWSLLAPALELSKVLGYIEWLWPAVGFAAGGLFVILADIILDKCGVFEKKLKLDGSSNSLKNNAKKRSFLLVSSITLHNIPEGLCVGVAIGAVAAGTPGSDFVGALLLALGIGIQNFPEGLSVALPLRREGMGLGKAFFFGQLSGLVEPFAAVLGFFLSTAIRSALPFALAFSAGAMIAVVASELLPSACGENKRLTTVGCIVGFLIMMILDVMLG